MKLPVLEFLRRQMSGELESGDETHMRYPTAISETLGFRIAELGGGVGGVGVPGGGWGGGGG